MRAIVGSVALRGARVKGGCTVSPLVSDPVGVTQPACSIVELRTDLSRRRALPFADHVHKLDATQNDPRTTKVLEALYRACDALDRAMVLLDNVVEVFALSDHDLGALLPIVVLDPRVVCAALVDVDDLGKAVVLDGAREEALRRTTIAFGGQQEVDGVPLLITRGIPIPVLPADLDWQRHNLPDPGGTITLTPPAD